MKDKYLVTADSDLPAVAAAPPPWTLHGSGWILLLRFPETLRSAAEHLPPPLRDRPFRGPSVVMFVDYRDSPAGPYRELLYIPGRFTDDGGGAWSVTRIWVSTWESVVNGRRNWGIPKDRADFVLDRRKGGERITVLHGGTEVARLDLSAGGPSFPVTTGFVPGMLRRLVQYHGGHRYSLTITAGGRVRAARLQDARGGSGRFPDLGAARTLAAVRVSRFTMTFPGADITAAPGTEER